MMSKSKGLKYKLICTNCVNKLDIDILEVIASGGCAKSGSVKEVSFDEPEGRITRARNRNMMENMNNNEKTTDGNSYIPGKRMRRFQSMPANRANKKSADKTENDRLADQPKRRGRPSVDSHVRASKKQKTEEMDEMSKVIALNCKLTNEILSMKKALLEKTDEFIKMQERYYQKVIECLQLDTAILDAKNEIAELKKKLDEINAKQFCLDLITFDDIGTQQNNGNLFQ